MAKTKISEFNANPALNTDIDSINISEGCAPSGINDAIRELMSQLKDWQSGTSNDPMVIGSSGSLTLNQGTANGVAYLNGSKVVTSGSALTFDGTNLGVGASSPNAKLSVQGGNLALQSTTTSGNTSVGYLSGYSDRNGTNYEIGRVDFQTGSFADAGQILFSTKVGAGSLTEAMRLTSTGLGIGTSSPAFKLQVVGASNFQVNAAGTQQVLQLNNSDTTAGTQAVKLGFSSSGTTKASINAAVYGNDYMTFNVGSDTERMRIDASGNLGLGVTPSAWSIRALQVGSGYAAWSSGVTNARMFANTYYDGSYKYMGTGRATQYEQDGYHAWYTAPSGTAGNAITFTQAATLDANGDFLVGKTTSDGRLTVKGSTSNGSTYTAYMTNSSNTELFAVRTDGLFETGLAANSPYNLTTATAANVHIDSQGWMYRSTSSLKYKTDVQDATHGLEKVMALRPVTYKGKNDGDTVFGGLIAEEVHEAGLTEFVQYAEDGTPDALAYGQMVSLAFKAIQELKAEFDAYKATHP